MFEPPITRAQPVTETVHGVEITDPYRWLEDGSNPEVAAWTEAQNDYTRRWLEPMPGRAELREKLTAMMKTGYVNCPVRFGNRYFFTARSGDADQAVLYVRENGQERLLVNPATAGGDSTVALDWWFPSPDGSLLAYGLSVGGDEISTLYVLDVATGQNLSEAIPYTRFSSVAWLNDSRSFYYTRYPTPGSVPPGDERYNRRVFYHRLGEDYHNDPLIYADPDPQAMTEVRISADNRYLLVAAAYGWAKTGVFWADLSQPELHFTNLTEGIEGLTSPEEHNGELFLLTNWQAPRFRVFKAPLANPVRENWQEIIPQGEHPIENLKFAGDAMVLGTLESAISHLKLYDTAGYFQAEIPLPANGTVYGPLDNNPNDEVLFGFSSFVYPVSAYRYLPGEQKLELFKAPPTAGNFDPASVTVKQVWYASKDGTKISMFVAHRAGLELDGNRPTWLTGYGGFNISRTSEYGTGALRLWFELGGVFALPNLRGGGEYGEEWHDNGKLGNKQNVFDDFAGAAEWLIANGYTNPNKLACQGGSNGGLLVGAALTQRPDLFKAVVCQVPLLDMVRYHLFLIARLWIPEYGSSEDPEQFQWLYAYSPYHHIKEGALYPATLITTGENDSRVDPNHARKMAALLQARANPERPVFLRTETRAGHGQGKPLSKQVEEATDVWSFLLWQLGVELK